MKTLKFNQKSWHYWLATEVASYRGSDFCAYVRSVICGAFIVLVLSAVVSSLLFAIGLELRAAYTCTFSNVCTFGKNEKAIAIAFSIFAGIFAFAWFCIWNENRRTQIRYEIRNGSRQPRELGFVAMAYTSVKEKTCFKVEFK